jgi:DNA-binding LytR/AlgR family response regulator
MTDTPQSWLLRYQPWKRLAEIAFWVVVLLVQFAFNTGVAWIDIRRTHLPIPFWQPLAWEFTSNLVVGVLLIGVVAFERQFPLRVATLPRNLAWHLGGSVLFCLAHVGLMLALRVPIYLLMGSSYRVGNWPLQVGYEYLKDIRTYAMLLAAIYSYRFVLLRAQGEARVLDAPEPAVGALAGQPEPAAPVRPERFLVRKLRKEFLIAAADIEWLQAEGNYVGLHVSGHDYLLRSTLSDFLEQLDPARFTRVHRSFAVNLDRIAEIEPTDGGDARLKMKDGSQVPCSRRYRAALTGTP